MRISFICLAFVFITFTTINAQWKSCNGPSGGDIVTMAVSGTTLFSGTSNSGVHRSTNDGSYWKEMKHQDNIPFPQIDYIGPGGSMIVISQNVYQSYYSTNNGENWNIIPPPVSNRRIKAVIGNETVTLICSDKFLFRTTDKGASWDSDDMPVGYDTLQQKKNSINSFAIDGTRIYAGTNNGLYCSTDNGQSWFEITTGLPINSIKKVAVSGSTIWIATNAIGIFRSIDNGVTWMELNSGLDNKKIGDLVVHNTIAFITTSLSPFISSNSDKAYRYDESNGNWSRINSELNIPKIFCFASNGKYLFAGTYAGIYRSSDNGSNWQEVNQGQTYRRILSLGSNSSSIFAGSYQEGVTFRSIDEGNSWSTVHSCPENTYSQVVVSNAIASIDNMTFIGYSNGGLYRSSNNGNTWEKTVTNGKYVSVKSLTTRGKTLFATISKDDPGLLAYRSEDYGTNWTTLYSTAIEGRLDRIYSVVDQRIYASMNGELFRSTDDGKNWTSILKAELTVNGFAVSGNTLFSGVNGGISRSLDGGDNWIRATEGMNTKIIVNNFAIKGTTIFACSENEGVFISKNNGLKWTPFGFEKTGVYSLIVKGMTLYAATKDSGVYKYDLSTLGISDESNNKIYVESHLTCYPNPTSSTLTIDRSTLQFPENTSVHYTLYTLIGGKVMEFDNSDAKFTVSLDGLMSGVYSLTAEAKGNRAAVMVTVVE